MPTGADRRMAVGAVRDTSQLTGFNKSLMLLNEGFQLTEENFV
jgi:hypothetical protein